MLAEYLKSALATLLVTVDPPGLAPIFLSLTLGMSAQARRQVALRAALIAFGIMAAFGLVGAEVMKMLGISLPAFRIAGGLLLFWIAFEMIFQLRAERKANIAETAVTQDRIRNLAAFPLATPLMAGPGAITATILLAGRAGGSTWAMAILMAVIALVVIACYIIFLAAESFSRLLGVTGNVVLTRLLGVILAALAVQFVIDGVIAVVRP
ncbi:MAG: MarC family protein [Methylobacteriaceae bacterium]|nr:MarC family protein [Methylobacteriaceae bacterium]